MREFTECHKLVGKTVRLIGKGHVYFGTITETDEKGVWMEDEPSCTSDGGTLVFIPWVNVQSIGMRRN